MYFSSRLALQQRKIAIAHENYKECNRRAEAVIERMRSSKPDDQRTLDYLSGLAEAAVERLKEAFELWNAEIDALSRPSLADDYRDYSQQRGYREEGDYRLWEPNNWTDLDPDYAYVGPGAMQVGELDDYNPSDCEEF